LLSDSGVVLGVSEDGKYIVHNGPEHIISIAPPRSGKGVGQIIPTLLIWPGSVVINDIKQENWDVTAGYSIWIRVKGCTNRRVAHPSSNLILSTFSHIILSL
jgi:hypothetical protein